MEQAIGETVNKAVKSAVSRLVATRLKELKKAVSGSENSLYEKIPQAEYHGLAVDSGTHSLRKTKK